MSDSVTTPFAWTLPDSRAAKQVVVSMGVGLPDVLVYDLGSLQGYDHHRMCLQFFKEGRFPVNGFNIDSSDKIGVTKGSEEAFSAFVVSSPDYILYELNVDGRRCPLAAIGYQVNGEMEIFSFARHWVRDCAARPGWSLQWHSLMRIRRLPAPELEPLPPITPLMLLGDGGYGVSAVLKWLLNSFGI
jgi:hypothetical protein